MFSSYPSGMVLELDGFPVRTPIAAVSWMNHELQITAPDQDILYFSSWSDGGEQSHTIHVGKSEGVFVATFSATPRFMYGPPELGEDDCVEYFGLCYENNDCCEDLVCRHHSILSAERACITVNEGFVMEQTTPAASSPSDSPVLELAKPSVSQPWIPIAERPNKTSGSGCVSVDGGGYGLLAILLLSNVVWMLSL